MKKNLRNYSKWRNVKRNRCGIEREKKKNDFSLAAAADNIGTSVSFPLPIRVIINRPP